MQPIGRLKDALDLMGDQYLLFVGICFVAVLINSVAQNLLLGSFACGVYLCFDDRMKGQRYVTRGSPRIRRIEL